MLYKLDSKIICHERVEINQRINSKPQLEMTSTYNGQFSGHILVVGKTGCGKMTFLEKLGKNIFFWKSC